MLGGGGSNGLAASLEKLSLPSKNLPFRSKNLGSLEKLSEPLVYLDGVCTKIWATFGSPRYKAAMIFRTCPVFTIESSFFDLYREYDGDIKELFVSDFVDGSDLFTLWKQDQVLPEELVKLYVAELALTLDFLHANGVIYRDLKLENVLLDRNGHAKIIDFGLSKLVTPGERRTTICGTLQYMAPEVLKGECYTAACDWWSLGIVMFTLLAGKYPYACQEDHNAQRNVVEETGYEVPSHVCESARDLLSQLLQKDPKLRLTSLESARSHPFFNCLSFDDVMAKKSKPLDEMTMKKLRRRSSASRMFFPRHVEQRKDRKPRPLSWASPGHFTIHDRVEMDFLVADLGSLSIMETPQDSNRDH
ncbi:ribosomal protein S6 kinase-related protein isoform X4 [Nematostella vectensis]|uniref:ribosomal protein S6 kinase-related protein isoform X4 n=1 Tax=Nematostella vectensis TaxID=45351 RepID=UPI001390270B|nr:ribosomal protein S6 kinase-related protein isoform X4 [Nematostella vectensis]